MDALQNRFGADMFPADLQGGMFVSLLFPINPQNLAQALEWRFHPDNIVEPAGQRRFADATTAVEQNDVGQFFTRRGCDDAGQYLAEPLLFFDPPQE
jgi:hypothetical protein